MSKKYINFADLTEVSIIEAIITALDKSSVEMRLTVFANYCAHCGTKDPKCQCWNDE